MVKNRIEVSRPIVIVDYNVEGYIRAASIFVENIGQTTAYNVEVKIPNKIPCSGQIGDVRDTIFKCPIKTLSGWAIINWTEKIRACKIN